MKRQILFFLTPCLLLFTSCATLLNPPDVKIKVVTRPDAHLVVNGDTIKPVHAGYYKIRVKRSKESLPITTFNDTVSKTVEIPAVNSFAYCLNIYPIPHLWTGFLIDRNNPKRYSYPRKTQIKLNGENISYSHVPYNVKPAHGSTIIKFVPHRVNSLFMPALEMGIERRHSHILSTNLMVASLLKEAFIESHKEIDLNPVGYRVAIEERMYFLQSAPTGPYLAFELDYLNKSIVKEASFENKNAYTLYRSTYRIDRQNYNAHLKLGYQRIVNHFSVEFFAGLGIRYRSVIHTYVDPAMEKERVPHFGDMDHKGKYFTISVPLNVRIGLAF